MRLLTLLLTSTFLWAAGPIVVQAPFLTPELRTTTKADPRHVFFDPQSRSYVLRYLAAGELRLVFLDPIDPAAPLTPATSRITPHPGGFTYSWQSLVPTLLVLPAQDPTFTSTTLAPTSHPVSPGQYAVIALSRNQFRLPWRYTTATVSNNSCDSTWLPGWVTTYFPGPKSLNLPADLPEPVLADITRTLGPTNLWSAALTYGPKYPPTTPAAEIARDYLTGLNLLTSTTQLSAASPFVKQVREQLTRLTNATPDITPLALTTQLPAERELLTALTIAFPAHFLAR